MPGNGTGEHHRIAALSINVEKAEGWLKFWHVGIGVVVLLVVSTAGAVGYFGKYELAANAAAAHALQAAKLEDHEARIRVQEATGERTDRQFQRFEKHLEWQSDGLYRFALERGIRLPVPPKHSKE